MDVSLFFCVYVIYIVQLKTKCMKNEKSQGFNPLEGLMNDLGLMGKFDQEVLDSFDKALEMLESQGKEAAGITNFRNNVLLELKKNPDEDIQAVVLMNLFSKMSLKTQMMMLKEHLNIIEGYLQDKIEKSDNPLAKLILAAKELKQIQRNEVGGIGMN